MRYYSNYVQLKHNSVFPTVHPMLADEWKHRKGPIQSVSPLITVLPQPRASVQLGAMCLFIILIQTVVQNLMSSGEFS